MEQLIQLIVVLLFLFAPLLKGVFEYFAEQKKKQEAKQVAGKIMKAVQENEDVVLAEASGIAYDDLYDDLVILDDSPAKAKRPPKIRSKPNRKKTVGTELPPVPVAQPMLAAAAEPARIESVPPQTSVSRPQKSRLAAELLKMFQSPTGVQQAVLAGEILKKRF